MNENIKEKDIAESTITPSNPRAVPSGFDGMKIVYGVLIVVVFFFGFQFLFSSGNDNKTVSIAGNEIDIQKEENSYHGEVGARYYEDLRIYGITDNREDEGWSPVGYADYFFMASTWTGDTEECERNDLMNTKVINIIAGSDAIQKEIEKLEEYTESRRRAVIRGSEVTIDTYFFEGKDHTDSLSEQGQINPGKAILVESIFVNK